jgi:hypothetical protein
VATRPLPDPPARADPQPTTTSFPRSEDPKIQRLMPSSSPSTPRSPTRSTASTTSGSAAPASSSTPTRGLVLADRNTLPVPLADVRLTFAGGVELPAQIVFLHPHHNYGVVRYDPALLGDTPVRAAELHCVPLAPGDPVGVVAVKHNHRVFSHSTEVAAVEPVDLPSPARPGSARSTWSASPCPPPSSRSAAPSPTPSAASSPCGSTFSFQDGKDHRTGEYGIPAELLSDLVAALRAGQDPVFWDLGVEFGLLSLAEARNHGLSPAAAARIEAHDPVRRQVLTVQRTSPIGPGWRAGDLLLAVGPAPADLAVGTLTEGHVLGDTPVTTFRDIERHAAAGRLRATILRDGQEMGLIVAAVAHRGCGTDRVIHWAGALLQAPHHAAQIQRNLTATGAYISLYWYGSPASRSRLRAARCIVAVDGKPTPDLDAFLAAVRDKPSRASVRLKTLDLDDKVELITLRLDLDYFPTYELRFKAGAWVRTDL